MFVIMMLKVCSQNASIMCMYACLCVCVSWLVRRVRVRELGAVGHILMMLKCRSLPSAYIGAQNNR